MTVRASGIKHLLIAAFLCFSAADQATAHGVGHTPIARVLERPGIAVEFRLSSGEAMVYAPFRLLAPGGNGTPFQIGQTDALGRIAFTPDRPGGWRIEVEDAQGHAAAAAVEVLEGLVVAEQPAWRQWLLRGSVLLNLALLGLLLHVGLSFREGRAHAVPRT